MIEGIKAHIQKRKIAYSFGTGVVIAGITIYIMRSIALQRGANVGILQRGVTNIASPFSFNNKQSINIITVLESQKGHPGWPIRCIETGKKWLTQGSAAKDLGVSESVMSGHIQGKLPDIYGLHFERMSLIPA